MRKRGRSSERRWARMLHFGEAGAMGEICAWGLAAVAQRADGLWQETCGREAMARYHIGWMVEDAGLSGGKVAPF